MKDVVMFLMFIGVLAGVILFSGGTGSARLSGSRPQLLVAPGDGEEGFASYIEEVEDLSARLGTSNAQQHLARASVPIPYRITRELGGVERVISRFEFERAGELLELVGCCEERLAEVEKAVVAEVNVAPAIFAPGAPQPNFFSCHMLCCLLLIKGMAMEQEGRLGEALEVYLTELEFASLLGGENSPLVARIVGAGCEELGYRVVGHLLITHALDSSELRNIIDRLGRIEATRTPLEDCFEAEIKLEASVLALQAFGQEWDGKGTKHELQQWRESGRRIAALTYPELLPQGYVSQGEWRCNQLDPDSHWRCPDFFPARVRFLRTNIKNRLLRSMAGLQLYYNEQGRYPELLCELAPAYLETVPEDCFSEGEFVYERNGNNYRLASVGPDLSDDGGRVSYDPSNGTISGGDIIGR